MRIRLLPAEDRRSTVNRGGAVSPGQTVGGRDTGGSGGCWRRKSA